ncbi:MAG: lactonase family protein [Pseudomonadales bacterium]|nr:lactonase family protein [Pseudomonadales bacterium]
MSLPLLIGTYTKTNSEGIYHATFEPVSGKLLLGSLAIPAENPSFLAKKDTFIYAVNEKLEGEVSAFKVVNDHLRLINRRSSKGSLPCHIEIFKGHVFVTNYGSGSIVVFEIQSNGSLSKPFDSIIHRGRGPKTRRQKSPHPHQIYRISSELIIQDLGTDCLNHYTFSPSHGLLKSRTTRVPPGSGPRHMVHHPKLPVAYVVNELANTVTVLSWQKQIESIQTYNTLPEDFFGSSSPAEIQISSSGDRIHISNRGHNSIVTFSIGQNGRLCEPSWEPCGGENPRFFCLDPTDRWMLIANQDTNDITTFRLENGRPHVLVHREPVPTPVCIKFL